MNDTETQAKYVETEGPPAPPDRPEQPTPGAPEGPTKAKSGWLIRHSRVAITLTAVAFALLAAWRLWAVYMGAPWTRDATLRAYVVTMAPEVAGRIVELHVVDNKYVRKGDLLMLIDPTDYEITVSQNKAAVQLGAAGVQNIDAQINVQHAQIEASRAQVSQAQAALIFAQQQAAR